MLRHLGYLFYASAEGTEITDQTDNYYPTSQEMQAGGEGFTDAVAAFERHVEVGSDGELKLDEEGLTQETIDSAARNNLKPAIETMNERIRAGEIAADGVFPSSNRRLQPYGQSSAQGGTLFAQQDGYTTAQYGEEPPPEDNCGGESGTYKTWYGREYYLDKWTSLRFVRVGGGSRSRTPVKLDIVGHRPRSQ